MKLRKIKDERFLRVLRSYFVSGGARASGLLMTFLTTPWIVGYLGKEGFGLWGAVLQIFSLAGFADLGLGNGLHNTLINKKSVVTNSDHVILVKRVFLCMCTISIFLLLLGTLLSYVFTDGYSGEEKQLAILVVLVAFIVNMPLALVQKVQFAHMNHHIFYSFEILTKLLSIGAIYIGIKLGFPIHTLLLCFLLPMPLMNAINFFLYRHGEYIKVMPKFRKLIDDDVKSVFRTGSLFLVMSIAYLIGRSSDLVVIGYFGSLSMSADYQVICRIFDIPFLLITMMTAILWSAFSEAINKNDLAWVRRNILNLSVLIAVLILIMTIILVFYGNYLVNLWLPSYGELDKSLFICIGVWYFLISQFNLLAAYLNATNRLKPQCLMFSAYAVFSPLLKVYMIEEYGLLGFVWVGIAAFTVVVLVPSVRLVMSDLWPVLKSRVVERC